MILVFGLALGTVLRTGQALADEPAGGDCPAEGCCKPYFAEGSWYFSSDGLALQRVFSGLGPAATEGPGSTGTVALSQQNLDDPFQAGVRLLVGHTFGDSPYQIEASYYWLNTLDTSAQVTDPTGNLYSPFTNFGFLADPTPSGALDLNSFAEIHLVSRLENAEVNLKYSLTLPDSDPRIVLLFGLRHVGIREEFDYSSSQAPFTTNSVAVHAHTNNNLWGPQIGGLVDYGCQDVWLRVEGKAAICNNSADRELETSVNTANATHPTLSNTGTAMVADISAAIVWRPTSALTARVGYQGMWVDQVALAARNFTPADPASLTDATANPPINMRGTLIYHGPFAGLQVSW